MIAGEVTAVFAWGFFKLGSQRMILTDNTMRIVTWFLTLTVGRNEVADVALSRQALTIVLIDGSTIEPAMFWLLGPGVVYLRAGFFRNAMSREKIREKILQWREPTDPETADRGFVQSLGQRRISRVRANLPLLVGLVAFVPPKQPSPPHSYNLARNALILKTCRLLCGGQGSPSTLWATQRRRSASGRSGGHGGRRRRRSTPTPHPRK